MTGIGVFYLGGLESNLESRSRVYFGREQYLGVKKTELIIGFYSREWVRYDERKERRE